MNDIIPIIGKKEKKENSENQKAEFAYQKEMSQSLETWEIDNKCKVIAILKEDKFMDAHIKKSVVFFHKLSNDELNDFKKAILNRDGIPKL